MASQSLNPDSRAHSYDVRVPQHVSPCVQLSLASTYHIATNHSLAIAIDYSQPPDSVVDTEDKMGISRFTEKIHQIAHRSPTKLAGRTDLESHLNVIGDGTYPRATRLQDGSILGVHTAFQGGANIISATRSLDHGVTWTPVSEITRGIGDIDNAFPVQLPSGKILCAFRNHTKDGNGHYTWYRITICSSIDNGASWQFLSTADENETTGLWEPFMRIARDGSLQLYYSLELARNDQDSIQRISYDEGSSWGSERTISGAGLEARDGMLGLAPYDDKLIAVFETNEHGPMAIKAVESPDDGVNWGNRQLIYAGEGSRLAAAPQVTNCGGKLVVVFQTDEDGTEGGPTEVKMITGAPGAWSTDVVVGPVKSCWAGVMTLDEANVLVMFDHGGCRSLVARVN